MKSKSRAANSLRSTSRQCLINTCQISFKINQISKPKSFWHNYIPDQIMNDGTPKHKSVSRAKINTARTLIPSLQDSPVNQLEKKHIPTKIVCYKPIANGITVCQKKHTKEHNASDITLYPSHDPNNTTQIIQKQTNCVIGSSLFIKDSSREPPSGSRATKAYRDFKSCIQGITSGNLRAPLNFNWKTKYYSNRQNNMSTSNAVKECMRYDPPPPQNHAHHINSISILDNSQPLGKRVSKAFLQSLRTHF